MVHFKTQLVISSLILFSIHVHRSSISGTDINQAGTSGIGTSNTDIIQADNSDNDITQADIIQADNSDNGKTKGGSSLKYLSRCFSSPSTTDIIQADNSDNGKTKGGSSLKYLPRCFSRPSTTGTSDTGPSTTDPPEDKVQKCNAELDTFCGVANKTADACFHYLYDNFKSTEKINLYLTQTYSEAYTGVLIIAVIENKMYEKPNVEPNDLIKKFCEEEKNREDNSDNDIIQADNSDNDIIQAGTSGIGTSNTDIIQADNSDNGKTKGGSSLKYLPRCFSRPSTTGTSDTGPSTPGSNTCIKILEGYFNTEKIDKFWKKWASRELINEEMRKYIYVLYQFFELRSAEFEDVNPYQAKFHKYVGENYILTRFVSTPEEWCRRIITQNNKV